MPSSLKGYIPSLARAALTTSAALYERQRALVRAGLLDIQEGRGPGSGVRTTPGAVALLLISVLSTDRLSESAERTCTVADMKPKTGRCPYTRRRTFSQALSMLIGSTGVAAGVIDISISRTADRAQLRFWDDAGEKKTSSFFGPTPSEPGISVQATISGDLLKQIAEEAQEIVLQTFDGEKR